MDDRRSSSAKSSGLPRAASRLPMPRTTPATPAQTTIPRPSRIAAPTTIGGGLAATKPVSNPSVNPRLRAVSSRDRMSMPVSARKITTPASSIGSMGPPTTFGGVDSRFKPSTPRKTIRKSISQNFQRSELQSSGLASATSRLASKNDEITAEDSLNEPDLDGNDYSPIEPDGDIQPALPPSSQDTWDSAVGTPRQGPRPSLSDRTIETLSMLQSSPAARRRTSNFFEGESPRRSPSRGTTARSRTGSVSSRPGSSYSNTGAPSFGRPPSRPGSSSSRQDNSISSFRNSIASFKPPLATVQSGGTPSKRISIGGTPSAYGTPSTIKPNSRNSQFGLRKTPSQSMLPNASDSRSLHYESSDVSTSKFGSKTVSGRGLKPRASMNGLFKKPAIPAPSDTSPPALPNAKLRASREASAPSTRSSVTSVEERNLSSVSPASTAATADSIEEVSVHSAKKSSAALRDQIAKAKAAKRAASRQVSSSAQAPLKSPLVPTDTSFDFELNDDPFGQGKLEDAGRKVMSSRIVAARTSGRLNISAMNLKEIPDEVLKMYDLDTVNGNGGSWAESVDLTRFVASDNEIEVLDDALFPDADPSSHAEEDDTPGHQFGGLETLDMRGNMLISLPMGLRRLQSLTSLNLAHNKLTNNCLEVISQINALRDLKLGSNLLYGPLEGSITNLENLESLDLHGNHISALPDNIERLSRLRILNINENDFSSVDFTGLAKLPLTELLARKNKLTGNLVGSGVDRLQNLHTLDVSMNQLTGLTSSMDLDLPSLHQLTISINRIKSLPAIGSWKSLLTIHAAENSIAAFPHGFCEVNSLRHVDFTSNDIRVVPPEISHMENLGMLRLSGNPLRDKKFTGYSTEELKNALASRLNPRPDPEPVDIEPIYDVNEARSMGFAQTTRPALDAKLGALSSNDIQDHPESDSDDFATPPTSAPTSPAAQRQRAASSAVVWPVKQGGILDRSRTQSSSLHPVVSSKLAEQHTIRDVRLQNNTFTCVPMSLSFFADTLTSLCIAHNELVGESYLGMDVLDLTALKELNMASNRITSFAPLTTFLRAPNLTKLDVSCNRIVNLPALRDFFPSLTVLLINDNHLEELSDASISGMKVVDARNNDIAHLNPRIGLLGGSGGLEKLDVTGNRFRIPRFNILDLGTEATLRWLRGRVPVAEIAEWKAKAGDAGEDFEF